MRAKLIQFIFLFIPFTLSAQEFIHPGILHTQTEIEQMRKLIKQKTEPAYGSFLLLQQNPCAQADYIVQGPFKVISRDGEYRYTKKKMESDFTAAYQNSLMWALTMNEEHARKALEIIEAYADTLELIPPTNDAPLLASLEGIKITYALEILRHTYKGMSDQQFDNVLNMLKTHFIPIIEKFFVTKPYTNGNWGAVAAMEYMAAAILTDDRTMYEKAKNFYLNAHDNGSIKNYINEDGQIQESGRDQVHCMLGIGALATTCEMAWKQGDDLYSALGNRLLKGYEYVAKYNLGYDDIPFTVWKDITGKYCKWEKISPMGRGRFAPIFEMPYNHYVNRKGMPMPYTEEVLNKTRPEGCDWAHPGFGSLLFTNQ